MAIFFHNLIDILRNTLLITGLVMVMMLLIEYINVASHGKRLQKLQKTQFGQLLLAIFLGLIPGCMGGFAVVSLFTHNIISFGALVAATIVATGDESFFMFAAIPKAAILINGVLIAIAIIVGLLVNKLVKKSPAPFSPTEFAIHSHCHHDSSSDSSWKNNLKHITPYRAILIVGIVLFILGLVSGELGHEHEAATAHTEQCEHTDHDHIHDHGMEHEEGYNINFLFNERWLNLLFGVVGVITLLIIVKVSDHFLAEHLWGHVIKKHFFKIFLWTFGALVAIFLIMQQVSIQDWISDNQLYMILFAILIGIIPESGPHVIFITLFAGGHIPFSILLANSITQEGHAALPLLAESKRGFIWMKGIKIILALIVGLLGYYIGF